MALAVIMLLAACTNGNKVVEFPLVGATNTTKLVFEKVELTDTATVLSVRAHHYPNYWIKCLQRLISWCKIKSIN